MGVIQLKAMFSGCMDRQTSVDVHNVSEFGIPDGDGAGGACTNALLVTLANSTANAWLDVLKGMRAVLKQRHFSQVPQLSTSRRIDVNDRFTLKPSCENNTRALLIRIRYLGQKGELRGCHNDVDSMKTYIATQGYRMDEENCKLLMDDGVHGHPDRAGIMDGFKWLVAGAVPGASLFMLYSGRGGPGGPQANQKTIAENNGNREDDSTTLGELRCDDNTVTQSPMAATSHGGSVEDTSGDEADGMDETICPVDYEESGIILDDEIFEELVMALPEGVTLTVVMDSCHSGSVLDLPYSINGDDGTIGAVEAGEQPSLIAASLELVVKMVRVGGKAVRMYRRGKRGVKILGKMVKQAIP